MYDQLVADNTQHSQQKTPHAPVGFEPTISAGERPKTYDLDRAATGTGTFERWTVKYNYVFRKLFYFLSMFV
jgi:hypothetical protein